MIRGFHDLRRHFGACLDSDSDSVGDAGRAHLSQLGKRHRVTHIVTEQEHGPRLQLIHEPLERLALGHGAGRPKLQDASALEALQNTVRIQLVDRGRHPCGGRLCVGR